MLLTSTYFTLALTFNRSSSGKHRFLTTVARLHIWSSWLAPVSGWPIDDLQDQWTIADAVPTRAQCRTRCWILRMKWRQCTCVGNASLYRYVAPFTLSFWNLRVDRSAFATRALPRSTSHSHAWAQTHVFTGLGVSESSRLSWVTICKDWYRLLISVDSAHLWSDGEGQSTCET